MAVEGYAALGQGISVDSGTDGVATITIDSPSSNTNVMDVSFIDELESAISGLSRDLSGVMIVSAKENNFIAGADLHQVLAATTPHEAAQQVRRLQRALNRLSSLPYPSVAVINGAALGGGFEVALACDYRVCAESVGNALGLPEVRLGLLPAGGGCQRLPRLIGLSRAIGLILEGRRYSARQARRYGAVDEVVHPAVLIAAARSWLGRGKRREHPRWSRLDDVAARLPLVRTFIYRQAESKIREKSSDHYPAPLKALEAVRCGQEQGFGAGLAAEAVAFGDLVVGDVAHELIGIFFATEGVKREQRQIVRAAPSVDRVGVVGAGFMGGGIAQACASAGYSVRVRDLESNRVAAALKSARELTESATRRRRLSRQEARHIVTRLSGSVDYSGFARAQLAIEAVFEDVAIKRGVISELEERMAANAVIASNTSSLPIGGLAEGARHPERIVGMHFFSPVHRMPLLEVVRGPRSSDWAVGAAVAAGQAMGKTVLVVNDGPGFFTTRVLALMVQEAARLFEQGAAIHEIDGAMTAFGFPVGPLALSDEVGIDVGVHISGILHDAFPDRFVSGGLIERMVEAGRLGRKSKRGFYDYTGRKKRPDPAVYTMRDAPHAKLPRQLIQRRLTLALMNECVRCLEDGIIEKPCHGDVGAVLGFGFPPFLGGPFRYADSLGAETIVSRLVQMEFGYGAPFAPATTLRQMAAVGGTFYPEAWA